MAPPRAPIPIEAWDAESDQVDESSWTPGGEGWSAWNGASPEREFCEFAAALVALTRPGLVVETGIGQGYLTRRILPAVPGRYIGYESDDELRAKLRELDVWRGAAELAAEAGPSKGVLEACELAIFDSAAEWRSREIDLWRRHAPRGAYVLLHDARADHPRQGVRQWVADHLGDDGVFLGNPRGSWLYRKPLPR